MNSLLWFRYIKEKVEAPSSEMAAGTRDQYTEAYHFSHTSKQDPQHSRLEGF